MVKKRVHLKVWGDFITNNAWYLIYIQCVFNKESISWSHTSNFTDKNTFLSYLKPGTKKKKLNQCSQANHWCYGQRLHNVYHGWHFILNFPHSCNSHVTPFTLFKELNYATMRATQSQWIPLHKFTLSSVFSLPWRVIRNLNCLYDLLA